MSAKNRKRSQFIAPVPKKQRSDAAGNYPRAEDGRVDLSACPKNVAEAIRKRRKRQAKYRRKKKLEKNAGRSVARKAGGVAESPTAQEDEPATPGMAEVEKMLPQVVASQAFIDQQYQPGQSGNPRGMAPGTVTATKFARMLNDVLDEEIRVKGIDGRETKATRLEYLIRRAVENAAKGDVHFWREVMDRIAPKPREEGPATVQAVIQFVFEQRDDEPAAERPINATIVQATG